MSVAEFRTHKTTVLPDPALQTLLEAAELAIAALLGPVGTYTELRDGGGTYLFLSRRAASITSISERYNNVTYPLAASDYEIRSDGISLRRLAYGSRPASSWNGIVNVTYVGADDLAERKRVQLGLVNLDLNHNPGLTAEEIGDWSATYANSSAMHYGLEREAILATLVPTGLGFA